MECLLKNVSVLIEEVSASSANYDSGRNLLSKLVRNYLTNNIALILQFLTLKNVAMSRSALEVLSRLQFETGDNCQSHLLLIESLTGCFFEYLDKNEELFRLCWKILSNLGKSSASFALIMRKFLEKLSILQQPPKAAPSKKTETSLFNEVRQSKSMPVNIMGVGVIGNGVKRMRVNENHAEKVEKINETVAVFLANQIVTDGNGNSLAKVEFDRLNT